MSTKIFDAYECKFKSIKDMHQKMQELRTIVHPVLVKKLRKKIAFDWATYVDDCTINENPIEKLFHDIAFKVTDKYKEIRKTGVRNISYDFYFEVVLIPYKDNVYLKIFAEDVPEKAYEFIKSIGKDFHYQNSTDRPESISKKEWERREHIWEEIIKTGRCWYEWGLLYDFSVHDINDVPFNPKEIKPYLPSKELRARKIASNLILKEKFTEPVDTVKMGDVITYIQTKEYKEKLEKKAKKIAPKLIEDICKTDLSDANQTQP